MAVTSCEKCHALLVNIPSGSLCPNGCGGLFPKVNREQQAAAVRSLRLAALPAAHKCVHLRAPFVRSADSDDGAPRYADGGVWVLAGTPGLHRRVVRKSASLTKGTVKGAVLAHDAARGRAVELVRYTEAEAELAAGRKAKGTKEEDADGGEEH